MGLPKKFLELDIAQRKEISDAFLKAFRRAANRAAPRELVSAINQKDVEAIMGLLGLNAQSFAELQLEIFEAYLLGGKDALSSVPKPKRRRVKNEALGINLGFNGRHPRAEAFAQSVGSGLITEITDGQRTLIQQAIDRSLTAGQGPLATAVDLVGRVNPTTGQRVGGLIGLTTQQASYVDNARGELLRLDMNYFNRARRDRRYDSAVREAMRTGKPLSQSQIDNISARYSDRLLKYRGEVIGRTESINALRAGRHEGYHQLAESGEVRPEQIIRVWDATGDAKTRPDHLAMDGQEIKGFTDPFRAPDGSTLMFPGDTSSGAGGDQTIQCRCFERIEIDYLADDPLEVEDGPNV